MCTGWGCPLGLHWPNKYLQWNRSTTTVIALLNPAVHKPEVTYSQLPLVVFLSKFLRLVRLGFALGFCWVLLCFLYTHTNVKRLWHDQGLSSLNHFQALLPLRTRHREPVASSNSYHSVKWKWKPSKPEQNCNLVGGYMAFQFNSDSLFSYAKAFKPSFCLPRVHQTNILSSTWAFY